MVIKADAIKIEADMADDFIEALQLLLGCHLQTKFARLLLLEPGTNLKHFNGFSLLAVGSRSLQPNSRIFVVLFSASLER